MNDNQIGDQSKSNDNWRSLSGDRDEIGDKRLVIDANK